METATSARKVDWYRGDEQTVSEDTRILRQYYTLWPPIGNTELTLGDRQQYVYNVNTTELSISNLQRPTKVTTHVEY